MQEEAEIAFEQAIQDAIAENEMIANNPFPVKSSYMSYYEE